MRSARSELWLVASFLFLIAFTPSAFAVEESPGTGQFLKEFEGVKVRLSSIEQGQQDILAQKSKIIDEIDRLRIWVRHNGS